MEKNFLIFLIFCSSSFFLFLDVNGDEISNTNVNNTKLTMSKKSKRAVGLESEDSRESLEAPLKHDFGNLNSFVKRAPSGFTGMRGKKEFKLTDLSPNGLDWNIDDENSANDVRYKKAPSGFQGVRGKKMDQFEYEKSFLDQLFRKLYQDDDEDLDNTSGYRPNIPLYSHAYSDNDDWEDNDMEKRAPSGFTGMRGKRPLSFPFYGTKRAPNAFFGVRGKRDFKRSAAEQFQPEFLGFRNKFVGVRGKKDSKEHQLNKIESNMLGWPANSYRSLSKFLIDSPELMSFKRAPAGFLGMRGKRQVEIDDEE